MGKVEGWKKIFPTELGRIDHFVDLVSSFLIETRTSVGVDKGVVRDVLVEARVKLVLAGLSLILGEIGVNDLRNGHFANPFHETGCAQAFH